MSIISKMEASIFYDKTTFQRRNNILTDSVSLMMDASPTTWHPVCLIIPGQCRFNAQKNQAMECINCQLIDFNSNLANCQWRIGTHLFWITIMFNTIPIAEHRNSQPPPSMPDTQWPTPLSHPKWRTFIRRPHNLSTEAMRIARPNSTTMEPMFHPELRKRGLSTGNAICPQLQSPRQRNDNFVQFQGPKAFVD